MHEKRPSRLQVHLLLPLLIPLLLFLRNPGGFPYPSVEVEYSDFAISHFPNIIFLKQTLLEYGTIPLWSPGIMSGYPFAANPLSGLWYPPGWIALLFPLPFGINLSAVLHLLWAGIGMVLLLRVTGLSDRSALFGGVVFMSLPKIIAHYGAGHLTLLYAVSWTPWLIFTEENAIREKGRWSLAPAMVLGMIFLADPRWAPYAGITWFLYSISHRYLDLRQQFGSVFPVISGRDFQVWQRLGGDIVKVIGKTGISILFASPLLVPLLEYTRLSTRTMMTPQDSLLFSLPPVRMLGLIYPDFGGNQEFMIYTGGVVLVLVLISVLKNEKNWQDRFWLWVGFLSLVYALGENVPLARYLAELPGFNLLRVPTRALFLTGMAFAMVSARCIDSLQTPGEIQPHKRLVLSMAALSIFAVSLAGGIWLLTWEIPRNFIYGAGITALAAGWIGLQIRGKAPKTWFVLLMGLAMVDVAFIDASVLTFKPAAEVLSVQDKTVQYLMAQKGQFRIYSPSYSIPQEVAMVSGFELADGVDPLQLKSYAEAMEKATGVPNMGYRVTIPPFENGNPSFDNAAYQPDPVSLGLLNVRYIVSEFDLDIKGLALERQFGRTRIYQNTQFLPRAWVKPDIGSTEFEIQAVELLKWEPNLIELRASGPGLLVLSEIDYPGWRVFVDDQPASMQLANNLLRAVRLGDGVHRVEYVFSPASVTLGLSLFGVGVLLVFIVKPISRRQREK